MDKITCAKCGEIKTIYNENEFLQFKFEAREKPVDFCAKCVSDITGIYFHYKEPELAAESAKRLREWVEQNDLENQKNQ